MEKLTKTKAVGRLVELAREVEIKDPIDWGMLNIREEDAYELMANSVLDQFYTLPDDHKETVMLATLTKLLVENFVLNLKLAETITEIGKKQ
jgi:hypothetical protein|tara:strand:- start:107 stop:382 length:276 start_codon:yes stop_codon:yes gene_type:complete